MSLTCAVDQVSRISNIQKLAVNESESINIYNSLCPQPNQSGIKCSVYSHFEQYRLVQQHRYIFSLYSCELKLLKYSFIA